MMCYEDILLQSDKLVKIFKSEELATQFITDSFNYPHTMYLKIDTIVVKLDEFTKIDSKYYGLYIHIFDKEISVWIAVEDNGSIYDNLKIGDYSLDTPFVELVNKCKHDVNICPKCGKDVGLANMHRYSFAGRCCEECLPKMREIHEQPGWYN